MIDKIKRKTLLKLSAMVSAPLLPSVVGAENAQQPELAPARIAHQKRAPSLAH